MTRLRFASASAVASIVVSLVGGAPVNAQSAPYHQQPYAQAPGAAYGQQAQRYQQPGYVPPVRPQNSAYQASSQPVAGYQVAQQQPIVQQQPPAVPPGYGSYQLPNYQSPVPTARYAMMQDDSASNITPESVPAPQAAAQATQSPAPVQYSEGYSQQAYPTNGVGAGCNTGATAGSWEGYVQAPAASYDGGCNTGACNTGGGYNGDCDYGNFGGGGQLLGGQLLGNNSCRQWFFGVYGLYMSRDNPSYQKYMVQVDSPASYPYYPTQAQTYLSTDDVEPDFQFGAEVRLGSTFGTPCGCEGSGLRPYAWEVVYWGLAEDDQQAIRTDALADSDRFYGSVSFIGLEYDRDGAAGGTYAYRPMDDYTDYQMPITDPAASPTAVRVLGVRARNNFRASNLELNFIRFPLAGGNGCDPCCAPRFTVSGTCGVRYYRMDEDSQIAWMFTDPTVGGDSTVYTGFPTDDDQNLFYDISTDNKLVGFQLGSNMNWLIGCKWSAFCDTQMGIYGNRITNNHRVWSGGGGDVRFVNGDGFASVRSRKTDVSFLGELRAGLGYQVGCNCRLTTAYRVVAATGVALSGEQIPTDWSNSSYVGIIDSNDSLVMHGIQTGVEWKY